MSEHSMNEVLAEIITIGDEILIGQINDTNSKWISTELDLAGIKVIKKTSIRDEESAILNELDAAFKRSNLILMTGGLGPTKDDITKKTIAKFFGVQLIRNEQLLEHVRGLFAKRGRKMNDHNLGQADLPANCTPLQNNWGTAAGMWFEHEGRILVSMPGVPLEMKKLMKNEVLPKAKIFFNTPIIRHKTIKTAGIGESDLMTLIEDWENALPENIKLAYLPRLGQVRLRLSGIGINEDSLRKELEEWGEKLNQYIPKYIYGYEEDTLEGNVGKLLKSRGLSLATAESCTGGHLAHKITSVSGSSGYFTGSVIAYSNDVKINELNVKSEDIEKHGAVSEKVVTQMAEQVRKKLNTDIGLATSGIAGPDGGTDEKPVGTIWIALADSERTIAKKLTLGLNREMNIELTSQSLLNLLRGRLNGWL